MYSVIYLVVLVSTPLADVGVWCLIKVYTCLKFVFGSPLLPHMFLMQTRSSLTDVLGHLLVERERHSRSMNSCGLSPAHTIVWGFSTGMISSSSLVFTESDPLVSCSNRLMATYSLRTNIFF